MGGIIDFSTTCPWQLYTFAVMHILGGLCMHLWNDFCSYIFPNEIGSCVESEVVMGRLAAICLVYVGVIFTVLTFHNKDSPSKLDRLSAFAMNGSVALLAAVILAGNEAHGGLERSWMHIGDLLFMFLLVGIFAARVSRDDFSPEKKNPIGEGHGINCKSLLLVFTMMVFLMILMLSDIIHPEFMLADGLEMTKLSHYLLGLVLVLVLEILLGLTFSLLFDDYASHEFMIMTIAVMEVVSVVSILDSTKYMNAFFTGIWKWIAVSIVFGVCAVVVIWGRRCSSRRYQAVNGEGANLTANLTA